MTAWAHRHAADLPCCTSSNKQSLSWADGGASQEQLAHRCSMSSPMASNALSPRRSNSSAAASSGDRPRNSTRHAASASASSPAAAAAGAPPGPVRAHHSRSQSAPLCGRQVTYAAMV